jgi:quinoprotein glucose dehydrogenase
MDPSAAPQLTTIRHNGRNRDVVVATCKTGWLYVFDRVTGEPIWPIEERPVPKSEMEGEQSWPTQPVPTSPPPYIKHSFGVDDISPYLSPEEAETFKRRLLAADNKGIFTPISLKDTVHVPTSNGGTLFGGAASNPRTGAVYIVAHDNPGILHLMPPNAGRGGGGGGAAPVPPGQAVYQQNCQVCHGADRLGTATGAPLVYATANPESNSAAGAPRFDAAAIRAVLSSGKGRMPAFPHLTNAEVDSVVAYLTVPPGGAGRGAGAPAGGGFRGRGAGPVASGAPAELIAGSGSAWNRPGDPAGRGRGRGAMPYPEGTPNYTRYTINEYNTVANRIKPPFTTIVKYDLNKAAIAWQIPFGDDPALAARGITGTGSPATNTGLIVTESGLVFGAGRDNQIRAWDSDTGKQLWSSRFGGNFLGSPVMYQMSGTPYLLVPAASSAQGRGFGAAAPAATTGASPSAPAAPMGWVAYALPGK